MAPLMATRLQMVMAPVMAVSESMGDEDANKQHFDECYNAAIAFIQQAFMDGMDIICIYKSYTIHIYKYIENKNKARIIFCHVTCATDQDTVKKVFWDIQNIVIRSNLRRGGLMQ